MTPELESEIRTTVASLHVRTACQELLILALPPPRLMTVARVAAEEDIPVASPGALRSGIVTVLRKEVIEPLCVIQAYAAHFWSRSS